MEPTCPRRIPAELRGGFAMKRLILALALGAAALAGCDEPRHEEAEPAPAPIEEPAPPPVEPPPPAPVASPAPAESSALPPDQRPSEETVTPESETLFY
jgi:hypothetical protein